MDQKTLIALSIFCVLVIAATFFIPVWDTSAFFGGTPTGLVKPFGGQIQCSEVCTCSGSVGIRVGPPLGGTFIFQPGQSTLYANGNIMTPGTWLLGIASQQTQQCLVIRGTSCVQSQCAPSGNTIIMVGTS